MGGRGALSSISLTIEGAPPIKKFNLFLACNSFFHFFLLLSNHCTNPACKFFFFSVAMQLLFELNVMEFYRTKPKVSVYSIPIHRLVNERIYLMIPGI